MAHIMNEDMMDTDAGRGKRDIPQLGKEGGQGSSGGAQKSVLKMYKSMGAIHDNTDIIIHYVHTLVLWGLAWKDYEIKLPNKTTVAGRRRVTSAGQFVRNELAQYISPADYLQLPPDCVVSDIGLRITPVSCEASFQTGSTLSGAATIKFGIVNTGANNTVSLDTVGVTLGADMTIAGITAGHNVSDLFWGNSEGTDYASVNHLPRNWKNYDSVLLPTGKYEDTGNIFYKGISHGQIIMSKVYNNFNMNECIAMGKSFDWMYKPKIGLIKQSNKAHGIKSKDDQFIVGTEANPMNLYSVVDRDTLNPGGYKYGPLSTGDTANYLSSCIEHGFWTGQLNHNKTSPYIPSFSFGMLPIPTNVPNTENSYVNAKTIIKLETYIKIQPSYDNYATMYPTHPHSGELMHYKAKTVGNLDCTQYDSNAFIQTNTPVIATTKKGDMTYENKFIKDSNEVNCTVLEKELDTYKSAYTNISQAMDSKTKELYAKQRDYYTLKSELDKLKKGRNKN